MFTCRRTAAGAAYLIERKIEAGELRDYAEAARILGVTRARLSQLADLVLLPADVQSSILEGRLEEASERQVRLHRAPSDTVCS